MKVSPGEFSAVLAAILLAGCGEQTNVESAVREGLLDGKSAEFRAFVVSADKKIACIAVNAKNSFGGYAGWQYVELRNGSGWSISKMGQDSTRCSAQYFQLRDEALRLSDEVLALDGVKESLRTTIKEARNIDAPDLLENIVAALRPYLQAAKDEQAAQQK
jgi:outer membrane murein-binding lipoprotein Lpp